MPTNSSTQSSSRWTVSRNSPPGQYVFRSVTTRRALSRDGDFLAGHMNDRPRFVTDQDAWCVQPVRARILDFLALRLRFPRETVLEQLLVDTRENRACALCVSSDTYVVLVMWYTDGDIRYTHAPYAHRYKPFLVAARNFLRGAP